MPETHVTSKPRTEHTAIGPSNHKHRPRCTAAKAKTRNTAPKLPSRTESWPLPTTADACSEQNRRGDECAPLHGALSHRQATSGEHNDGRRGADFVTPSGLVCEVLDSHPPPIESQSMWELSLITTERVLITENREMLPNTFPSS